MHAGLSRNLSWCFQILRWHKRSIHAGIEKDLAFIVEPKNVLTTVSAKEQFGRDESHFSSLVPDVVVRPRNTKEVAQIVKYCHQHVIPMIPFGTGSGVEGGVIPIKGGVTLDLSLMNNVLEVHPEDFDVVVQPGVTRKTLNTFIRDTGLWFPVDPGADASIGGMASTSASGTNAVRYGTMRENVLNLEVVLADGTILNTAGEGFRSKKTSAGYNLTNLFIGSEGTLGIFTKIYLKLHAVPESIISAVCNFPTLNAAVTAAITVLQHNIPVARVELLDSACMTACNRYHKMNYPETPTLFFEFHGSTSHVEEQAQSVGAISSSHGSGQFHWAKDAAERNRLWHARHTLLYAVLATRPGCQFISSDTCVPISKLLKIIEETQNDLEKNGIYGPILGHVGEGNFHCILVLSKKDPQELAKIQQVCDNLARRAWLVGGTCTGEHGVGMGKMHLLEGELGKSGVATMRLLKTTLDPLNIMNPGKVINI